MYELEVIETVTYSKFDDIVKIKRKKLEEKGKLFVGDIVTVKTKEEADYLCGSNPKNVVACKIISEPTIEKEIDLNSEETNSESKVFDRKFEKKKIK